MKALINPNEPRETGYRVCEVSETEFEVCSPLFWVDCSSDLLADIKWFDPSDNTFKDLPPPATQQASVVEGQPVTEGTQTI
jgi:hypothetical protein